MKIQRIFIFFAIFLVSIQLSAQETIRDNGLQALSKHDDAPKATDHWGKLVGHWDIIFESIDAAGNVQRSFEGEWNWFYILNGFAIQDVFILPPRKKAEDPKTIFYGVGIRIYNEEVNKWESVWVDTSNKKLEFREASSNDNEIILYQTNNEGEKIRITYFDMEEKSFEWKQEVFSANKNSWIATQLIHAKKH